jgi:hypothetical protein
MNRIARAALLAAILSGSLDAANPEAFSFGLASKGTRFVSKDAGAAGGSGLLLSSLPAPYRIEQLDWKIAACGEEFSYRHEIDRMLAAIDVGLWGRTGQFTIGRQAVGMGRGLFFGANDIFSPFSPAEVDREWRRGIDAARLDLPVASTASFDIVGAFGDSWEDSALIGRARGYSPATGNEAAVVMGKRARDAMLGLLSTFRAGEAAIHLDAALFRLPDSSGCEELMGMERVTAKAVAGFSQKLFAGQGPYFAAEYHYSGFGVAGIEDLAGRMEDEDFVERLGRGDLQIVSRHAFALDASLEITGFWSFSLAALASPADGSGLVLPSISWNFSDKVTFLLSGAVPFGKRSEAGELGSEYGASPASVLVQASFYE